MAEAGRSPWVRIWLAPVAVALVVGVVVAQLGSGPLVAALVLFGALLAFAVWVIRRFGSRS